MDEQVRLDLDAIGNTIVRNSNIFERLPDWMKDFGRSFLQSIQDLHDEDNKWDSKGLSKLGKNKVNDIIDNHNLNIPKYE